ncbi:MAG: RidA family protein [Cyclobacteriaceae bacterium]
MSKRVNYASGAKWEKSVGYSRAVRKGHLIEVSGTVAILDGEIAGIGDAYVQTKRILDIIRDSIEALGGTLEDVVRTRMYVTDISNWEAVGRAHGEVFEEIQPATSMVEVSNLIDEKCLVEIEATAMVQ